VYGHCPGHNPWCKYHCAIIIAVTVRLSCKSHRNRFLIVPECVPTFVFVRTPQTVRSSRVCAEIAERESLAFGWWRAVERRPLAAVSRCNIHTITTGPLINVWDCEKVWSRNNNIALYVFDRRAVSAVVFSYTETLKFQGFFPVAPMIVKKKKKKTSIQYYK